MSRADRITSLVFLNLDSVSLGMVALSHSILWPTASRYRLPNILSELLLIGRRLETLQSQTDQVIVGCTERLDVGDGIKSGPQR